MTENAVQSVRPVASGDIIAASPFLMGPFFSDLAPSATGRVAFTQRRFPGEPGEIVLWRATPSTDDHVVLTHRGHSPVWSSDGHMLAYISARYHDEICILVDVETPHPSTVRLGSDAVVESLAWMPRSRRVLAVVAPSDADGSVTDGALRPESRGWPAVRKSSIPPRRIVVVDIDGPSITWIDLGATSVWEAAGFDDGRFLAVVSDDPTESGWYGARLSVIDELGERPVYLPGWQVARPSPSPSGQFVSFVEGWSSDRGRLAGDLVVLEPSSGEIILRTSDTIGIDATSVRWLDDAMIWVSGWSGVHAAWATIEIPSGRRIDGATIETTVAIDRSLHGGLACLATIAVAEDGRQAVELLEGDGSGDRSYGTGRTVALERSIIRWLSPDGLEIEGILVRGTEHPPTDQRLIVMVHGGPASLWTDVPPVGARALVAAGYAVLLPNPRGSVGRGQGFVRANLGDPGGKELDDILAGAAACRHRGLVMDASPGIVGGSYGGYLTACAAVFSTEVAAAVAMFGHPDLLSARLGSNNGAFYDYLLAGSDGSIDRDLAYDRSPAFHVDHDVAPMLLLHGDRDACTPLGQSEELFGALVAEGVEAEFVVYEGAGHGLRGVEAQQDVWRRTIAWFDRHLEEGAAC